MQGNAPIHAGQGPGLSLYDLGETGGSDTVSLLETEMPSHQHGMLSAPTIVAADSNICTSNSMGKSSQGNASVQRGQRRAVVANALAPARGDLPHNNLMPYLTLNFCIAMQGVFPPRG